VNEHCPAGHPADGAPCVSYSCGYMTSVPTMPLVRALHHAGLCADFVHAQRLVSSNLIAVNHQLVKNLHYFIKPGDVLSRYFTYYATHKRAHIKTQSDKSCFCFSDC